MIIHGWSDGLTAVISCFLVLKLPGCGSHNSARHRHLRPSHAIACASTTWIDIAMEVEISVPSEASNWQTKTDPQFIALCINPWTLPLKGRPNWRLAALYKNNYWNCPESHWYHLQSISDISEVRCLHRAKDSPRHSLFTLLPTYILLCSPV